jgi:hypothetical protein
MEKSNTPDGLSLTPEFKEVVKRIKDKEPELESIINKDNSGGLDPERTVDHLKKNSEH